MTDEEIIETPIIRIDEVFHIRMPMVEEAFQLSRVIDANRERLKLWLPWLDVNRSVQDSEKFILKCHSDWEKMSLFTGLIYKEAEIVGAIGFHSKRHRILSIGYWIADKYAARGLCTSACTVLIDWAFLYDPFLHMIELCAATENKPSRRVAERLQFKFEAELRDREWLYDRFVNHAIYTTTREEWETMRAVF